MSKYSKDVEFLIQNLKIETEAFQSQISELQRVVESHREPQQEYRLCPDRNRTCTTCDKYKTVTPCPDSFLVKRI